MSACLPWPQSVGILGAGALGSLLAHGLAGLPGGPVIHLLARSPGPDWVAVEGQPPRPVHRLSKATGSVDLLLVLVKAYATADALRWASGAVGPETVALTLQNGLGNAELLAGALEPGRVLAGTTALGAILLEPGLVRHGGHGPTAIAPWAAGGPAERAAPRVAALLSAAGFPTEVAAGDPRRLLWAKLAVNAGINALTAILRLPNGALLEEPGYRQEMEAAAREAAAVAAALGFGTGEDPAVRAAAVARATAANRSSMLRDLECGRRTEVEAINGAVVAHGQSCGIPTPVNRRLLEAVRRLEAAERPEEA